MTQSRAASAHVGGGVLKAVEDLRLLISVERNVEAHVLLQLRDLRLAEKRRHGVSAVRPVVGHDVLAAATVGVLDGDAFEGVAVGELGFGVGTAANDAPDGT